MREAFPRILLVDDDPAILETVQTMLEAGGYACLTAANGFEALKILRLTQPEVIISDLRMPHMSGYELLPIVRRRYPQITLIVMSAEDEQAVGLLGLPIDAYLQKGAGAPFRLLTMIREILSHPRPGEEDIREADGESSS